MTQMKHRVNDFYFSGDQQITATFGPEHSVAPAGAKGGCPKGASQPSGASQCLAQLSPAAQYIKDIAELETKMKANEGRQGHFPGRLMKAEFQALIVQFAMQRRFEHVVLGCRFYRQIMEDANGIIQLQKGSDAEKMFASSLGTSPTINFGALDSFANEAIRDVG